MDLLTEALSPALNATVMRCLEKRAADRWQSASELVVQLDAASTPTAGLTPSSAQTTVTSSGTEAALRRGHPARVAAIFVAIELVTRTPGGNVTVPLSLLGGKVAPNLWHMLWYWALPGPFAAHKNRRSAQYVRPNPRGNKGA